jgi:hypothetical protein
MVRHCGLSIRGSVAFKVAQEPVSIQGKYREEEVSGFRSKHLKTSFIAVSR